MRFAKLAVMLPLIVIGCGSDTAEIQAWMKDQEKTMPREIEPLPSIKPFDPFTYEKFDLPEPFKKRDFSGRGGPKVLPPVMNANRRREPLESYPLEQLKMVGILQQNKEVYALIKADKVVHRVRKGAFMGNNFGKITNIDEGEIKLLEIITDSAGEFIEKVTVMQLAEDAGKEIKK